MLGTRKRLFFLPKRCSRSRLKKTAPVPQTLLLIREYLSSVLVSLRLRGKEDPESSDQDLGPATRHLQAGQDILPLANNLLPT